MAYSPLASFKGQTSPRLEWNALLTCRTGGSRFTGVAFTELRAISSNHNRLGTAARMPEGENLDGVVVDIQTVEIVPNPGKMHLHVLESGALYAPTALNSPAKAKRLTKVANELWELKDGFGAHHAAA
jgi:hypothetical protein